jgi:hypothetical protein
MSEDLQFAISTNLEAAGKLIGIETENGIRKTIKAFGTKLKIS